MSTPARRGVVAVVLRGGRFLVIRRSATVVAPLAYCFPGGGIETGESEEAALVRELTEELEASVRPVRLVWRSTTPWGVELAWWLAELTGDVRPNPAEVHSCHWHTAEEMAQLPDLLESNREFLAMLAAGALNLEPQGLPITSAPQNAR